MGYAVAQLVETLLNPEGRGFDSYKSQWNFLLTMGLRPTQPLTEMDTMNIYWGVKAAGA
jgi:hypothetical protein